MRIATVSKVSAFTPIGCSALQTAMCARTSAFEPRTVAMRDKRDQEIGLCLVGGLGAHTHGYERMVALGAAALTEIAQASDGEPTPLVVAVPEAGRPDDDERFQTRFTRELASRAGLSVDKARAVVVRADRAGVGQAVTKALDWLEGGAPRVVVGGVDSYFHPEVLRWLDEAHRLQALGAEDGFIPGEAAAFFVLERGPRARGPRILHALVGHDPSAKREPPAGAPPDIAQTMTQLLRQIADEVGEAQWVLHDINGERHRLRWWALASARETVDGVAETLAIPRVMGDVGAATGAVAVAIAHSLWAAGIAPHPRCLVALHGEDGERGALCIEGRT